MAYFDLVAGEGWLYGQSSLEAGLKAKAEEWADSQVDEQFLAWDRSTWQISTPAQIAEVAELLAAGHYLELVAAKGQVEEVKDTLGAELKKRGLDRAEEIRDAGGPINAAGDDRIGPEETGSSSRYIELEPT